MNLNNEDNLNTKPPCSKCNHANHDEDTMCSQVMIENKSAPPHFCGCGREEMMQNLEDKFGTPQA